MSAVVSERPNSELSAGIPGFDRFVWYFLRVSGLALVILACGHLIITHFLNVPSETVFDFVANRWANPLWRTFDFLLLFFALWHGILGMRLIVIDLVRAPGWRVTLNSLFWVIGIVFFALGTITIFAFDEAQGRANTGPLADAFWVADIIVWSLYIFAVLTYVGALALVVYIARHISLGTRPIYRGDLGQYAWILHRVAGAGILFFLLVHILDIMLIGFGREVYDEAVEVYANAFLIPMEIALVGAVFYHTLNDLRIILINFSKWGLDRQKLLFWAALGITVVLTAISAWIIVAHEFL
jgi:succinate dehydrogenase / fumarate reductase membrane anchor subunit